VTRQLAILTNDFKALQIFAARDAATYRRFFNKQLRIKPYPSKIAEVSEGVLGLRRMANFL
jgi:hypothetical protein